MNRMFNTTGVCVPHLHYMVNITNKLTQIKSMVYRGDYFVINRPRQYGKTTTMVDMSFDSDEIGTMINGVGFDFKEVQISEEKRFDIVVTYLSHKYVIEFKIWRGTEYHKKEIVIMKSIYLMDNIISYNFG